MIKTFVGRPPGGAALSVTRPLNALLHPGLLRPKEMKGRFAFRHALSLCRLAPLADPASSERVGGWVFTVVTECKNDRTEATIGISPMHPIPTICTMRTALDANIHDRPGDTVGAPDENEHLKTALRFIAGSKQTP